jgi:hypothetical protein
MTDSNYCKLLNCLQEKIKRMEKDIYKLKKKKIISSEIKNYKEKGKLFNISDKLEIIHLNPDNLNNIELGEYIFSNNKIYKYKNGKCETEFKNYMDALNGFKNSIIEFCNSYETENVEFNNKLVEFNECLHLWTFKMRQNIIV